MSRENLIAIIMATLEFHGPFHFDEFNDKGLFKDEKKRQTFENPNKPGIYIWGFMYEYDNTNKPPSRLVNFKEKEIKYNRQTMQFIPCYVGKDENNMFISRLYKHHDVRNNTGKSDGDGYTRLRPEYMTKIFFKDEKTGSPIDPTFPIHTHTPTYKKQIVNLIKRDNSNVTYFNFPLALNEIYPGIILNPVAKSKKSKSPKIYYPITQQKRINGEDLPDPLFDIVDGMNNFWFCYAIQNSKEIMKDCETFTFYSLKGKTLGKTDKCPKPGTQIVVDDKTSTGIFKETKPSTDFPGY